MRPGKYFWVPVVGGSLGLLISCSGAAQQPLGWPEPSSPWRSTEALVAVGRAPLESPFVQRQLQYARVRAAHAGAQERVARRFREARIRYPAAEIFVRVFKRQRMLEVWARPERGERHRLLASYPICALAGTPGPKQRRGDRQVPEGFYSIISFNPASDYHLSLELDYPNRRDRARNAGARDLGGDIFIHGGCRSEGCVAITNEGIEELYLLALMARGSGQERIPVHIFPARLDEAEMRRIEFNYVAEPALIAFWKSLKPGYDYFERTGEVPRIGTDAHGRYVLAQ